MFKLIVLHNRWLGFLIRGLNLKFSVFGRLLGWNFIDFVPCVGILIVGECQNALKIDKSLHSETFLHTYKLDLLGQCRIWNAFSF